MNLITGATGIVGAQVALQLLKQQQPVVAIKRSGSDVSKTKKLFSYYSENYEELFRLIKWVEADVNDIYSLLDALEGISVVYHCAGFVSFDDKKHTKKLHKINAEGTANVVNACLEKKGIALCHISSIATLQNPDITTNITESIVWKSSPSVSQYAISKYNAEREVWRGIEEGLQAVIVNPGIILSAGFWEQSSSKLFSTCYNENKFYTNGSSASIDVRDVAQCMIQLTNSKQFAKRFILIENNYCFQHISFEIHKLFNKKTPTILAGKPLLWLAQWADYIACVFSDRERLITQNIVTALLEKNTYSNKHITETLNYKFIPLEESIQFICKAYLNDLKK